MIIDLLVLFLILNLIMISKKIKICHKIEYTASINNGSEGLYNEVYVM